MDSVTQVALGSAVAVAVMGRKVPVWQAALWGAVAGTAPDLDVVVDFGDAILNMTQHRSTTHAIAYLTIAAIPFAGLARIIHGAKASFWRWMLAFWLVLVTHVGIDYMTVYGTQLALPWSDYPFGRGSIYIVDPLYTLPLLIGLGACLWSRSSKRWTWNALGLLISTLYMGWTVLAQQHVTRIATAAAPANVTIENLLVTPSPLNTVLWRVLATTPEHYYEGWYSLLDDKPTIDWVRFDRGADLIAQHGNHPGLSKVANFSHGFYRVHEKQGDIFVTDLRMGFEPNYIFDFNLGPVDAQNQLDPSRPTVREGASPPISASLGWLSRRILGHRERQPGG